MKEREYDLRWSGPLTVENAEQVAGLLRELLTGKKYTFVSVNEFFDYKPNVKTGQSLRPNTGGEAVTWQRHEHDGFSTASVCVHDTDGAAPLSTQQGAAEKALNRHTPHLDFERDRVTITHRNGAGQRMFWVYVLESTEQ